MGLSQGEIAGDISNDIENVYNTLPTTGVTNNKILRYGVIKFKDCSIHVGKIYDHAIPKHKKI